jgi:hypothetical protein
MSQLPIDIFSSYKTLSLIDFCKLMKIKINDLKDELYLIETAYNNNGIQVISLYHINSMKYILSRIINIILPGLEYQSMEYYQYKELANLIKNRIDKINHIEQKVFSPSKKQRYEIW